MPLAAGSAPTPGEIQKLTPSCDALYVPDIDASLDEEGAKRAFWKAFRSLGEWYSDFPPYRSSPGVAFGGHGGKAHVLVVANRTAESEELLTALLERAKQAPTRFTLLVPATPHGVAWAADMHSGGEEAEDHMAKALQRLSDAGLEVEGILGDPDPIAAVRTR